MSLVARMLFSFAKSQAGGMVVGSCFAHLSFLLPVKRLYENRYLVAFYHPKPAYPRHIVLVPKKIIPNLLILNKYPEYATAIFRAAQELVTTLHWQKGEYALCANGGERQDVQQVHFHLFCGDVPTVDELSETEEKFVYKDEMIQVGCRTQADGRLCLILSPHNNNNKTSLEAPLTLFLRALPALNQKLRLVQRGYTLLINDIMREQDLNWAGYIFAGTTQHKEQ